MHTAIKMRAHTARIATTVIASCVSIIGIEPSGMRVFSRVKYITIFYCCLASVWKDCFLTSSYDNTIFDTYRLAISPVIFFINLNLLDQNKGLQKVQMCVCVCVAVFYKENRCGFCILTMALT